MKPGVLSVIHEWGGDGMCWCVFGAGWGLGRGLRRERGGCIVAVFEAMKSVYHCASYSKNKFVFVVIAWSQLFTSGWLPHVGRCLAYGRYSRNSDAKEGKTLSSFRTARL